MIKVDRKALLAVAEIAARIADSKQAFLSGLYLELRGDRLEYRATDAVCTVSGSLPASGKPAACCPNAREIVRLLGLLDGDELAIDVDKASVKLKAGGTRALKTATIHPGEFPPPIEMPADWAEIPGSSLRQAIEGAFYAAAPDSDIREQLKLIRVRSFRGALEATATDGYRVSRRTVGYGGPELKIEIPKRAAAYLRDSAAEAIGFAALGPRLFFRCGDEVFACQMSHATFPPAENTFFEHKNRVEIETDAIRSVLRAARNIGQDLPATLDLQADRIVVKAVNPAERGGSEVVDEIAVDCPAAVMLQATASQLEEAVANCPLDHVVLSYGERLDPINFEAPGYLAVVMPRWKDGGP